jgi:hypothetical protein
MASLSQRDEHRWKILSWDPRWPQRVTQYCPDCKTTVTRIHPLRPPIEQPSCAGAPIDPRELTVGVHRSPFGPIDQGLARPSLAVVFREPEGIEEEGNLL